MSNINQGLQFVTFDFKHKAKGYDFNRLNREVLKPGVYKGMSLSFTANDLIISSGNILINGTFQFDQNTVLNNILVKIDFETSYTYVNFSPSRQQAPFVFYDELVYLHYEYDEVIENYAEFRKISVFDIATLSPNDLIIGSVSFDSNANINGVSYFYREYGSFTYETDYGKVESDWHFNKSHPEFTTTKKWRIDSSNLQTGKYVFYLPDTTPVINGSEKEYDLLLTNNINTTLVKNDLFITRNITSNANITQNLSVTGTTNLRNVNVVGNASVSERLSAGSFYGRVPVGGVIPVIGVFSLTNNGGTFTSASVPSSGTITDDGFQRCDGSLINNVLSSFNGKFTPDITGSRFIRGSVSAGAVAGNNSITISESNLPPHAHSLSNHTHTGTTGTESANHSHSGSTGGADRDLNHTHGAAMGNPANDSTFAAAAGRGRTNYTDFMDRSIDHTHAFGTSGVSANHTHTFTSNGPNTNTTGNGNGNSTSIDTTPRYIDAVYLIRVI